MNMEEKLNFFYGPYCKATPKFNKYRDAFE